jgi:hypothetical protein
MDSSSSVQFHVTIYCFPLSYCLDLLQVHLKNKDHPETKMENRDVDYAADIALGWRSFFVLLYIFYSDYFMGINVACRRKNEFICSSLKFMS